MAAAREVWLRTSVLGLAAAAVLATAPGAAAQTLLGQSEPVNLLPLTEPETQTGEDAPVRHIQPARRRASKWNPWKRSAAISPGR